MRTVPATRPFSADTADAVCTCGARWSVVERGDDASRARARRRPSPWAAGSRRSRAGAAGRGRPRSRRPALRSGAGGGTPSGVTPDHDQRRDHGHDERGEQEVLDVPQSQGSRGPRFATSPRRRRLHAMTSLRDSAGCSPALGEPPGSFVTAAGVPRPLRARRRRAAPWSTSTAPRAPCTTSLLSIGDRLAERYTAVAFDRPGSGFSGRPAAGRRLAAGAGRRPARRGRRARPRAADPRRALVRRRGGARLGARRARGGGRGRHARRLRPAARRPAAVGGRADALTRDPARRGPARPLAAGTAARRRRLRRAFFPGRPPAEYARIAPALALDEPRLVNDGEDRKSAEAGLRALQPRYAGPR